MHHTLRFYAQHRQNFLRLYIYLARLTRIPLLGRLVRWVANAYGRSGHHGYILTLSQAEQIVDISKTVALGPCSCRQVSHKCDSPVMTEIVVGMGIEMASSGTPGELREISKEEAKEILRRCHEKHMLHTIMKCRAHFYAICNCCACCCVPTRLRQNYKIRYALVKNSEVVKDFERQLL